jgi:predicted TPR repeat methyltransferase
MAAMPKQTESNRMGSDDISYRASAKTAARVLMAWPPWLVSPTWPIMKEVGTTVFDADGRLKLAKQALEIDPGCMLAHNTLGGHAEATGDHTLARFHYTKTIEVGEDPFRPVADALGERMRWAKFDAPQPYLAAIVRLADMLRLRRQFGEAAQLYRRLAEIDPDDTFSGRFRLEQIEAVSRALDEKHGG